MPTAKDLLIEASSQLHGWGSTQDRITPLSTDIGPGDTSFTVDYSFGQSVGITPGVVEIDGEQLYVVNVDASTGNCALANGFGRGYNNTTPAAHTAGTGVISRPRFPRIWLLKEMNEVIGSLFPNLFVPKTFTSTVKFPSNTYTITPTPQFVIDAQWQDPIGNWQKCQSYTLDPYDGTFRLGGGALIGRPLRVIYATEPVQFSSENDDFSVTGLPDSCADLLTLGVVARLVPGLDISRAQLNSVEQSDRSRVVPPFAGVNAAKYLEAKYQMRLDNESASLRRLLRPRLVKVF